jgi:hypothetical protein
MNILDIKHETLWTSREGFTSEEKYLVTVTPDGFTNADRLRALDACADREGYVGRLISWQRTFDQWGNVVWGFRVEQDH